MSPSNDGWCLLWIEIRTSPGYKHEACLWWNDIYGVVHYAECYYERHTDNPYSKAHICMICSYLNWASRISNSLDVRYGQRRGKNIMKYATSMKKRIASKGTRAQPFRMAKPCALPSLKRHSAQSVQIALSFNVLLISRSSMLSYLTTSFAMLKRETYLLAMRALRTPMRRSSPILEKSKMSSCNTQYKDRPEVAILKV